MADQLTARVINQVLLNRAYMKTILANQCIIMANQSGSNVDHRSLYNKMNKEVYRQFKEIIEEEKKAVGLTQKGKR